MITQEQALRFAVTRGCAMTPFREDFVRSLYFYANTLVLNGGIIVEIGVYRGASTVAMACGIHGTRSRIISIDPVFYTGMVHTGDIHEKDGLLFEASSHELINALYDMDLSQYVSIIPDYSSRVLPRWTLGEIDLLMVDGEHTPEAVTKDCRWMEKVRIGGHAVFDDWLASTEAAVEAYLNGRTDWQLIHKSTSAAQGDYIVTIYQRIG